VKVGIFGAGAIGAYVGIQLSSAGVPVTMIGRPWIADLRSRLHARSIAGREARPGADLEITQDPGALADCDICLLSVKSRHTNGAAETLADVLPAGTPVLSLQNGLRNPERLRAAGIDVVVPGMVGFNVFLDDEHACFRQATSGPVELGIPRAGEHAAEARRRLAALGDAFERAGEEFKLCRDIEAVQRGKLLLNLNNGVCAVAGVSISASVAERELRRVFSRLIVEGLQVFRRAKLPAATVGKLPPQFIARLLPLPDWIVLKVAPSLIKIDERAKSSTLQDLEAGKPTEIDDLSGEIVRLGERHGVDTPANRWIVEQIHKLEKQGDERRHPSPTYMADATARAPSAGRAGQS